MKCLIRDPYLAALGLVINNELKVIICEGCKYVISPKKVKKHILKKHPTSDIKINLKYVLKICTEHGINMVLPVINSEIQHIEYLGLKLHSGFSCKYCEHVCGTIGSLGNHYTNTSDHGKAPRTAPRVHYQRLTAQGLKGSTFFKVLPRASLSVVTPIESMLSDLRKAADKVGSQPASKLNARQIDPWMLSTKWYLHVEGTDSTTLKGLVAPTKEIGDIVKAYFAHTIELLGSTDFLVLQKINSPDHIKEYVKLLILNFA